MKFLSIALLLLFPLDAQACFKDCKPDYRTYRLTRQYEGLRLFAYGDVAGNQTIGFGHLIKSGESFSQPITSTEAEDLLEKDEAIAANGVNSLVNVVLTNSQAGALDDFVFNLGSGALTKSTLLEILNNSEYTKVSSQFLKYDKARVGGVLEVFQGLLSRRKAEASLYEEDSL
jgi:lysozyme